MIDSKTVGIYNQRVEEYLSLADQLHESSALESFMKCLPAKGFILDLGCGPGVASAYMAKQGFLVDAIDASVEMIRLASVQPGVNAVCADFADLNVVSKYDGVWANFSLLHATFDEFAMLLSAIHRALKPNGIFHIGMKLGDGSGRDHLGRFYSYYTENDLTIRLEGAGFSIKKAERGEGAGLAGTIDPWILLLCVAINDT